MSKNETPNERFLRIAEARTQKIIEMVRLLGNCSNTYVYEFSKKDVTKIFDAIDDELAKTKKKFANDRAADNSKFTLR
ncbi:hypothetical protein [Chryseobacterium sp.]|uniref:hypothetical protein n=1 Tax=Chryseobacterium sp. TaxID=1871047 RepID=UPI002FC6B7E0